MNESVDWNEVWKNFDEWFYHENRKCSKCGQHRNPPDWEDQQKKIEKLVEKQLERR